MESFEVAAFQSRTEMPNYNTYPESGDEVPNAAGVDDIIGIRRIILGRGPLVACQVLIR